MLNFIVNHMDYLLTFMFGGLAGIFCMALMVFAKCPPDDLD